MRTLKIGISDHGGTKARAAAPASGRHESAKGEPAAWFSSVEGFAKALWRRNRELLEMIGREKPDSPAEPAELAGRSKSNLSRTLKRVSRRGLVELERGGRGALAPRVPCDRVRLDVSPTRPPMRV